MESTAPSAASTPKSSFILQDLTLAMPENELTLICGRLGESISLRRPFVENLEPDHFVLSFHRFRKVSPPPRSSRGSRRSGWSTHLPSFSAGRDGSVQGRRRRDRRRGLDRQASHCLCSSGELSSLIALLRERVNAVERRRGRHDVIDLELTSVSFLPFSPPGSKTTRSRGTSSSDFLTTKIDMRRPSLLAH